MKPKLFESHITVVDTDWPSLHRAARELRIKPLHIVRDSGSGVDQLMTAAFHPGATEEEAWTQVKRIAAALPGKVIRKKLELILPANKNPEPGVALYEEFHTKWQVDRASREKFRQIVHSFGGHTSENTASQPDEFCWRYLFVTCRKQEAYAKLTTYLQLYQPKAWWLVNVIREVVVRDTNPELDQYWSPCMGCPVKTQPLPNPE